MMFLSSPDRRMKYAFFAAVCLTAVSCYAAPAPPRTALPDDSHTRMFPDWYRECTERVTAIQGKPCDLIFIGDSITELWRNPGKPIWEKYYANRHALNFGVPGDTTGNVLWRLDHMNVRGLKPKAAVILIGTNDFDDTPSDIAAGVKAVLDRTREIYPHAKIILLSILPNQRAKEKMAKANETIRTFGDGKTVFYLDLASKMPPIEDNWKGVGPDHLHLDSSGYELWASEMEPLLKLALGE